MPLALKENLRFNQAVHEKIAIVTVKVANVPHVPHTERVSIDGLGSPDDGIVAITITLGFNDSQNLPHNLEWSHGRSDEFEYDAAQARYFLSVLDVHASEGSGFFARVRKGLFVLLTRVAGSRVLSFRLPPSRTVILGGTIHI